MEENFFWENEPLFNQHNNSDIPINNIDIINERKKGKIIPMEVVHTQHTYMKNLGILTNLALSRFEWENLPANITDRIIERFLFYYGRCGFFADTLITPSKLGVYNFMTLPFTYDTGGLDVYGEPISINVFGKNGYTDRKNVYENCVIIRNDKMGLPLYTKISLYAKRLTNIDRTIDVNIYQQRTPTIIETTKQQKKSVEKFLDRYDEFAPQIIELTESGDVGKNMRVHNAGAPFITDKLGDYKRVLWEEILGCIGIHSGTRKRERQLTNENNDNNHYADAILTAELTERQQACEKINEMFGLNISVKIPNSIDRIGYDGYITEKGEENEFNS